MVCLQVNHQNFKRLLRRESLEERDEFLQRLIVVAPLEVTGQLTLDDRIHVDRRDGRTLTFRAVGTAGPVELGENSS